MKDCVEPLVSVIVPVYNAGRHLYKCLDSLVNQTLRDIEIIAVLDCPTDGSDKVVEEFAANDSRIKIVRNKENLHIGNSRNEGLKVARGKYIGFSDHDDYSDPRMYEVLYRKAEEENLDLVCSPYISVRHEIVHNGGNDPQLPPEELIHAIFASTVGALSENDTHGILSASGAVWRRLFRTEIIRKHKMKFVDTKYCTSEDCAFVIEYALWGRRAGVVNEPLYYHNLGISNTGATLSYHEANKTICYIEYIHTVLNKANEYKGEIAIRHANMIAQYLWVTFLSSLHHRHLKQFFKSDIRRFSQSSIVVKSLQQSLSTYGSSKFKQRIKNMCVIALKRMIITQS